MIVCPGKGAVYIVASQGSSPCWMKKATNSIVTLRTTCYIHKSACQSPCLVKKAKAKKTVQVSVRFFAAIYYLSSGETRLFKIIPTTYTVHV
jgi:hypothetical protein